MSDSTNAILQRAYELIEEEELEQAQELLAPLLETDDKNPSLWWVYSHALRDKSIGQLALDRVLELDPAYPGAKELKEDVLDIQSRDNDFLESDADESLSAQDVVDTIDDWDDVQPELEESEASPAGRQGAVILAVILFVVAAGIAVVASGTIDISEFLSGILPSPEAEVIVVSAPTVGPAASETEASESTPDIAVGATALPSAEDTDEPTLAMTADATVVRETAFATLESTAAKTATATAEADASPAPDEATNPLAAFVGAVADSISDFEIDRRASAMRNTLLGRTVVIQVCAVPGREFNARLNQVISAMAALADQIPESTEAVAAGLLNCDDDSASLRIIGVPVGDIQQYLAEDIDAKEFQRAWQPLP